MRRYFPFLCVLSAVVGVYLLRLDLQPVLVEGIVGQPVNLSPVAGPESEIDETIEALLFRSLFVYDRSGGLVSDLAESYEVGDGGRAFEVKLRGDVFWHDQYPIVAEDIVYTFRQDPAFAGVKMEVTEEGAVRIELEKPLASFLSIHTRPIAPSHLSGEQAAFPSVGSGSFRIKEVRQSSLVDEVVLQNLNQEGDVKELVFKFFQSQALLEEAARRGEVDAFTGGQFDHPSFTKYEAPLYGRYFAIFFNLESENTLIKNSDFRKAAARKIPLSALVDGVLKGGGSFVKGPLSGTWAEAALSFPEFSPTLKGGYSGSVTLTVPGIDELVSVAEVVAEHWRELGVKVVLAGIDPTAIEATVATKDFEAILLGQEVDRDPDRYSLWHSTQKDYPGLNISSYENPRADRALEEGRKAMDNVARQKHYDNFQQLFLEDNPAVFLYHPNLNYFVSRKFSGIDLSSVFVPADRFWGIQEWKKL